MSVSCSFLLSESMEGYLGYHKEQDDVVYHIF